MKLELLNLHHEICKAGREIMEKKNHDYSGGNGDPYANFRGSTSLGVSPVVGILLRMQDKIMRVKTFDEKGKLEVENEGVKDALVDIVNYAVLIWGLIKEGKLADLEHAGAKMFETTSDGMKFYENGIEVDRVEPEFDFDVVTDHREPFITESEGIVIDPEFEKDCDELEIEIGLRDNPPLTVEKTSGMGPTEGDLNPFIEIDPCEDCGGIEEFGVDACSGCWFVYPEADKPLIPVENRVKLEAADADGVVHTLAEYDPETEVLTVDPDLMLRKGSAKPGAWPRTPVNPCWGCVGTCKGCDYQTPARRSCNNCIFSNPDGGPKPLTGTCIDCLRTSAFEPINRNLV